MQLALLQPSSPDLRLAEGAALLGGFALAQGEALIEAIGVLAREAPFRQMHTPGGQLMSVAMTNAGDAGWISDSAGYRYSRFDPDSGLPWPPLPSFCVELAGRAAERAGFPGFVPDACLINRYSAGARISQHLDGNERDYSAPIVTVSLGLPATFYFGGPARGDPSQRLWVQHGDVMVWGGPSRLAYHGLAPLEEGWHPLAGPHRYSLTFRRAL
jgi:alkylated DNA repair protein (DNA oxidative demethylase)